MFFQYQGLAEPLIPPAGPDAWEFPPQVPMRRKVAAAVAIFMVAPVLVPPDASQFEYPPQVPVQRVAFQYDSSVSPLLPIGTDSVAVLVAPNQPQFTLRRAQPDSTVLPLGPIGTGAALEYPPQVPVRRTAFQYSGTVTPLLSITVPFDPALFPRYPAQIPVRRSQRNGGTTVLVPPRVVASTVIDVSLVPVGGCGEAVCDLQLAVGPVLDRALFVTEYTDRTMAVGPVLDKALWVRPTEH